MSCDMYGALSSDHLDGLLTVDEESLLEAHLVTCPNCRERHEDLVDLRAMFGNLTAIEPLPGFSARFEGRLARESESKWGVARRWFAGLLPVGELLPTTTAAAILLMIVVGIGWPRHLASDRIDDQNGSRHASMLTVWDSDHERIVASVDAGGFVRSSVDFDTLGRKVTAAANSAGSVSIFLFESIVVRG